LEDILAGQCVYEISRYGVSTNEETLVDRARLRNDNGELKVTAGDGPETACNTNDVAAFIGAVRSSTRSRQINSPGSLRHR
jgi:hypothetical protein